MRILTTGSSGMIGSALVNVLTNEGHEVYSLVRPGSNRQGIQWEPGRSDDAHEHMARRAAQDDPF